MKNGYYIIGILLTIILFIVLRATLIGDFVNQGLTNEPLHFEKSSRFKGTLFLHKDFSYFLTHIDDTSLKRNADGTCEVIPSVFKFGKWKRNLLNGTIHLTPNGIGDSTIEVKVIRDSLRVQRVLPR